MLHVHAGTPTCMLVEILLYHTNRAIVFCKTRNILEIVVYFFSFLKLHFVGFALT